MALMESVEIDIPVGQVRVGMWVCRLDRPWLETPFTLQGFEVQTDEQLLDLSRCCKRVVIDERRGIRAGGNVRRLSYQRLDRLVRPEALVRLERLGFRNMRGPDRPLLIPVDYPAPLRLATELPRAGNAWKALRAVVAQSVARAKAGKPLLIDDLNNAVVPIIESVVRSPDASMWLMAQRRGEAYPVGHPLNCCALILMFSRFLSFPPEIMLSLAKAALVFDIGMWRLDQNYYIKRDVLIEDARNIIEEHVLIGLEYLSESGFIDIDASLAITHHHERFDGNGYPRRVRGDKVSLMGFMLQIADTFDALCSRRSHQSQHTVHEAQRILYEGRGTVFPEEVLEYFFQAIGVYPTGSLVELSTGEIAAVSGQADNSRLYPWVVPVLDPNGGPIEARSEVWTGDLIKQESPVKIVRGLRASECPVRIDSINIAEACA